MKKLFVIFLTILLSRASAQQHLTITVWLPDLAQQKITIQYLDHFKGDIPVDSKGKFATDIILDPGYYFLKGPGIPVYLEPGMSLDISKTNEKITFTGKGSLENTIAEQIIDQAASFLPLERRSLTNKINFIEPSVFVEKLNNYKSHAGNILKKARVRANFKLTQKQNVEYFCQKLITDYVSRYGIDPGLQQQADSLLYEYVKKSKTGVRDANLLKKYNDKMQSARVRTLQAGDSSKLDVFKNFDMNNELAYRSSEYYRLLLNKLYINLNNKLFAADRSLNGKALSDKVINDNITNPFIRREMQFQYVLSCFRINRNADKSYEEYASSGASEDYVNDIKTLYLGRKALKGTPVPDFSFTDTKGSEIALSSMKGNYLYIDVWATYCISCIGQMQYLKLLGEKYKGKNIRFVSISADRAQDEAKWKKFIADNQLTGTQLIMKESKSDFHKFFKIAGIPRFILIDPKGIIISEEALRPDEPDLQNQIDQLLAKN